MAKKLNILDNEIGAISQNVDYTNSALVGVSNVKDALDNVVTRIGSIEQTGSTGKLNANGSWVSLGTSITWHDTHTSGYGITSGYQTLVRDKINFTNYENRGVSSAIITGGFNQINNATIIPDYVTIEFGVNDFALGGVNWLGKMDDFVNDVYESGTSTFYSVYRALIKSVYAKNPNAKIILCTPRKADGGGTELGHFPEHWYTPKGTEPNLRYLKDYADAVIEIGKYMSFPVCDWFNECNTNDDNLALYSRDAHLHPNDAGYKLMADVLIDTFRKIIN